MNPFKGNNIFWKNPLKPKHETECTACCMRNRMNININIEARHLKGFGKMSKDFVSAKGSTHWVSSCRPRQRDALRKDLQNNSGLPIMSTRPQTQKHPRKAWLATCPAPRPQTETSKQKFGHQLVSRPQGNLPPLVNWTQGASTKGCISGGDPGTRVWSRSSPPQLAQQIATICRQWQLTWWTGKT